MTNQISTQVISFHGSELITLKVDDVIYTAVKPIAEALGINWATQARKLENSKDKFGCCHMTTPTNGGMQSMLCMPLKKLNGWLFSINPEKVRADLREKVIQYQEECFEALYNYWHFGKAERTINPEQQQAIQEAVVKAHHRTGMSYAEIYRQLKSLFKVGKYDQLKPEQFEDAIGFLNNLKMPTLANELNEQDLLNIFEFFYCTKDFAESVDILLLALKHFDSTHQRSVSCRYDRVSRRLKLTLPAIEHIYQLLNGRHHSKVLIQN